MMRKERIAPLVLMFVTAGMSFLVCEGIAKHSSMQEQPLELAAAHAPTQSFVAPISVGQPRNFAQRLAQKMDNAVHSSHASAALMESSNQREQGLRTVQPESASAGQLDDVAVAQVPLDLSLVPGVIILPKAQEPLASSGLYDKRTHQKL